MPATRILRGLAGGGLRIVCGMSDLITILWYLSRGAGHIRACSPEENSSRFLLGSKQISVFVWTFHFESSLATRNASLPTIPCLLDIQ